VVELIGPQDLGHRVVVRRVVGGSADRPLMSDALGILTSFTETQLTLATDAGPLTLDRATVVAAKRVPPRPPRRPPRRS
jgi:hypothetical protein